MNTPDEEVQRKVREWLACADDDLRFAHIGMTLPVEQGPPYHLVAYHAQQCAEKHLKAYLVCLGIDFPRTHNISTLLELCSDHARWPVTLRDAEELTHYAVATRYPGEAAEVTAHDARRAIELAERVRSQVRAALRELGMELIGEEPLPESPAES
jgi:HEPN domain-containing protein